MRLGRGGGVVRGWGSQVDLEQLTDLRHLRLVLRQLALRLTLLRHLGLHRRVLVGLHRRVHCVVVPAATRWCQIRPL